MSDSQRKSEDRQFLEAIALQLKLTGDTLEAFLGRFSRENATKSDSVLGNFIAWNKQLVDRTQKLRDETSKIRKILEKNGYPNEQRKRGRPPEGQSPWKQAFKWLWESRFPEWRQQNYQPSFEPQEEAVDPLSSELKNFDKSDEKYKLYKRLADIYQELKEPKTRAIVLEKAIVELRNNTKIRSRLAFLYHEIGLHNLSLLHYRFLLNLIPGEKDFINMIGIQYERLDLTISAARAYKEAADLGLSVAASNLFYLYLNAPIYLSVFPEEVERLLGNYRDEENVNPNVLSALSDIGRFKGKEKDEELKHLEGARKIQSFLLLFADKYFIEKSLCTDDLTSFWYPEEDKKRRLKISSDELQIKAVFIVDFGTRDFFVGQVANQAAVLSFPNNDVGYAYLSSDTQRLHVMRLNGYRPTFYIFVRNTINPA